MRARLLLPFALFALFTVGCKSSGGAPMPSDGPDAGGPPPPPKCGALTTCGQNCVDLDSDPMSCGSCDRTCVIPNAVAGCQHGECVIARCQDGYYDTDGKIGNGCESMTHCVSGSDCVTTCNSTGRMACNGPAPTCTVPTETCNGQDDDCNGRCDEGAIAGCRIGVHRSLGSGGHFYTTDLTAATTPPYSLEAANYFYIYATSVPGMQPMYLCPKPSGLYFLTGSATCEGLNVPGQLLGYWGTSMACEGEPLYRLYNDKSGDHFYTTSNDEQMNAVAKYGYRLEGVVAYVFAAP